VNPTERKHTPGPWLARETSAGQSLVYSEPTGKNVAVCYDPKDGPLVGAAPELLTACREALAYVQSQPDAPQGSIAEVAQCGIRYELKTAIARAEGRLK